MANHSDAQIEMECLGCLSEMIEFIDSVNANKGAMYRLIENDYDVEQTEGHNSGIIRGRADGRWSYKNNITAFLERQSGEEYPHWVATPPKGLFQSDRDYKKTQLYYKRQQAAYDLLRVACDDEGGSVNIDWIDLEMGTNLFEHHEAEFSDGNYTDNGCEQIPLTPENLVEYHYLEDLDEAKDWLGVE